MKQVAFIFGLLVAGAALAHDGVKNPAVMARMQGMEDIGAATKVLGQMAKGATPFDQEAAVRELSRIVSLAAEIEPLFKAEESDPKSEALPAIWADFPDFTAKAAALQAAAGGAALSLEDLDGLRAALGRIGDTCKACHRTYRK